MPGGEQQMLTIARTLMGNPSLVPLDEPSEGLAPKIVEQMIEAIGDMKREGLLVSAQNLHFARLVEGWKAPAASRRPSSGRHPAPTFSRERERTNASHSPWEGGSQQRSRTNASHSPWDEGGCPGHGPNRPS